jgi:hypothetical protein
LHLKKVFEKKIGHSLQEVLQKKYEIHNGRHRGLKWEGVTDETYDNVASSANGAHAEATSTANNPVNTPSKMIDNSDEPWVSHPGVE